MRSLVGAVVGLCVLVLSAAALRFATTLWTGWGARIVVGVGGTLAVVGVLGASLAAVGMLRPGPLCMGLIAVSVGLIVGARGRVRAASTKHPRWAWVAAAGLVLGALGLRTPPMDALLRGDDVSTYRLRATAMARSGALTFVDPVLARAGQDAGSRSGPYDILGLFPLGEGMTEGRNEAAYAPGFTLVDRSEGVVVGQGLHGYPALLAVAEIVGGDIGVRTLVLMTAAVNALLMWALACWLLPRTRWRWFPALAYALCPLVVAADMLELGERLQFPPTLVRPATYVVVARGRRDPGRPIPVLTLRESDAQVITWRRFSDPDERTWSTSPQRWVAHDPVVEPELWCPRCPDAPVRLETITFVQAPRG